MSSYVTEIRGWPDRYTCPYHGKQFPFKKKGKFWHCPGYAECGYSIGTRPLGGEVTRMWIQQTKRGRAWVKEREDLVRSRTLEDALAEIESLRDDDIVRFGRDQYVGSDGRVHAGAKLDLTVEQLRRGALSPEERLACLDWIREGSSQETIMAVTRVLKRLVGGG